MHDSTALTFLYPNCLDRDGIWHLSRKFHLSLLGCSVAIGRTDQNSPRNDPLVHCHGDIVFVSFAHI